MDKSKVRDIVGEHMRPMKLFLNINEWGTTTLFEPIGDGLMASITTRVDYKLATIKFDAEKLDSPDEVIDTLFHELCHILHWPFDLNREIVAQMIPDITDGQPNGKVESRAWHHSIERFVFGMEQIWNFCGWRNLYLEQFTRPVDRSNES